MDCNKSKKKPLTFEQKCDSPSSSSHSRSSDVPSSLVERVLVVRSQLYSVLGVTTFVSEGSPGNQSTYYNRYQSNLNWWTSLRAALDKSRRCTYCCSWKPLTGLSRSGGKCQNLHQEVFWDNNRPVIQTFDTKINVADSELVFVCLKPSKKE